MKKTGLIAALAGVMLAGCALDGGIQSDLGAYNWGNPKTLRALEEAPRQGDAFSRKLADEYQELSTFERSQADWRDFERWARKGLLAAQGTPPAPELPERWDVEGTTWSKRVVTVDHKTLYVARERLTKALAHCPKAPEAAAQAQVAYDCWVEELEEGWEKDRIDTCKARFEDSLGRVEATCATADFNVYFGFGSAGLDKNALQTIKDAFAAAGKKAAVELVGWTDTMGSRKFNLALSKKRLKAVRARLLKAGIPAENIVAEQAMGETRLPVDTGDQTRESSNRRVTIKVKPMIQTAQVSENQNKVKEEVLSPDQMRASEFVDATTGPVVETAGIEGSPAVSTPSKGKIMAVILNPTEPIDILMDTGPELASLDSRLSTILVNDEKPLRGEGVHHEGLRDRRRS